MNAPDRGPFLQTYTGKHFHPFDPRPEEIDIEDIAHALSHECRWGGHTTRFYSVAWHSVMVARALEYRGPLASLRGLLHDASEAYLRDIPRPLKLHPSMAGYRAVEASVQAALYAHFGLPPNADHDAWVHEADNDALCEEAYTRLLGGPVGWVPEGGPMPLLAADDAWWPSHDDAKTEFLRTFSDLKKAVSAP